MLYFFLVFTIIVLGLVYVYAFLIAPRINPLNRAQNYISQNMIEEAVTEYKKILDVEPKNFTVHYKLADLYLKKKDIDQSAIHLEEVMKIGKFNFEIDKADVMKKLAGVYLSRDELDRAFQTYLDIVKFYPTDHEALYQVSFISLGQELFDLAQRFFERLIKQSKKNFEIFFGAAMAFLQNQKIEEAVVTLKDALAIDPHSDIANIAMSFIQQKKRDFKTAINYARMVADSSKDLNAIFIAKRHLGFLFIQAKKPEEGLKAFEDILEIAKKNDMTDETNMLLYDMGFAAIKAEKTQPAYEYWNELYKLDRSYKNVQWLTTLLRKEMDRDTKQKQALDESIVDYIDEWIENSFPNNYIWKICGLKSDKAIDLSNVVIPAKIKSREENGEKFKLDLNGGERVEQFNKIDGENFRIISGRLVTKLGYKVDDILSTYRESDGVDFLGHALSNKEKTLIWVRRWRGTKIGEIPLRNFAQAVNDQKAKQGLFISTTSLTDTGEAALTKLNKVTYVSPEQVAELLEGLV